MWPVYRAKFSKAYSWAGIERFILESEDAGTKTWISEIGLSLPADIAVYVGVLDADSDAIAMCPSVVPSCFASGVVKVGL